MSHNQHHHHHYGYQNPASGIPPPARQQGGSSTPSRGYYRESPQVPPNYPTGSLDRRSRRLSGGNRPVSAASGSRMSPGPNASASIYRTMPLSPTGGGGRAGTPGRHTPGRPASGYRAFSPVSVPKIMNQSPAISPIPFSPISMPSRPAANNSSNSNSNGGYDGYGTVPSSVSAATAEIVANQSQDYVDEQLAEFQNQIFQLQGKIPQKVGLFTTSRITRVEIYDTIELSLYFVLCDAGKRHSQCLEMMSVTVCNNT